MGTVERILGSDVVLFWLDEHICKDDNCLQLRKEFEANTTNIYLFHDVETCRQFLKLLRNKKVFCIIQGKHAKSLVPDIEKATTLPVVYIFCFYMLDLCKWGKDFDCILEGGIFDHEKDLLASLTRGLADYADTKAQEYKLKRAACEEWAEKLANNAKRMKTEQCTLLYKTDPLDERDSAGEQPE